MNFFIPKIFLNELLNFLKENNCIYILHRSLTKEEITQEMKGMSFINKLFSYHSYYIVIGYSLEDNLYRKYKLKITNSTFVFIERSLQFIVEKDEEINKQLQKDYASKILIITDKCPACKTTITIDESKCSSCGLMIHE